MNTNKTSMALFFLISASGLGLLFASFDSEETSISAQHAVQNYLIDKTQDISIEETSMGNGLISSHHPSNNEVIEEEYLVEEEPLGDIDNDLSGELPDHNMAEFFRYLQTDVSQGNTSSERAESIRDYLLTTLPREKSEELINLYEQFTHFETDVVAKAEEWNMPENAGDTLELIEAMQNYQQEYFGEANADLLFGADMKVMEYDARKAIIINDPYISGSEKAQYLKQLGVDMWGESAYQAMNASKTPHEKFEEQVLLHRTELSELDPVTREQEIQRMRESYLDIAQGD